jgi:hypothetical protein
MTSSVHESWSPPSVAHLASHHAGEERTASTRAAVGPVLSSALDSATLRLDSSATLRLDSAAPGSIWWPQWAPIQCHQGLIRHRRGGADLCGCCHRRDGADLLACCRRKSQGRHLRATAGRGRAGLRAHCWGEEGLASTCDRQRGGDLRLSWSSPLITDPEPR